MLKGQADLVMQLEITICKLIPKHMLKGQTHRELYPQVNQ